MRVGDRAKGEKARNEEGGGKDKRRTRRRGERMDEETYTQVPTQHHTL